MNFIPVKFDESDDPVAIGLFGLIGAMMIPFEMKTWKNRRLFFHVL